MKTQDEVLNAAAYEIVRYGYAASSLSSISAHLGLTKGALVRRFPTKEDFAWGIIDTLRRVINEERERSLTAYPHSGICALTRFLLAIGSRMRTAPQLAAAVVLFTDRASPAFEVAELFTDWQDALAAFFAVAQREGEIAKTEDIQELAEYVFITNVGQAVFVARAHGPAPSAPRLRLVRRTLKHAGVDNADQLIDHVLHSEGPSLDEQPTGQ